MFFQEDQVGHKGHQKNFSVIPSTKSSIETYGSAIQNRIIQIH